CGVCGTPNRRLAPAALRLDAETEVIRRRGDPGRDLRFGRRLVEGVVQLDRGEPLGVVAQEPITLEATRIEPGAPIRVGEPARPDVQPAASGWRTVSRGRRRGPARRCRRPRSWSAVSSADRTPPLRPGSAPRYRAGGSARRGEVGRVPGP